MSRRQSREGTIRRAVCARWGWPDMRRRVEENGQAPPLALTDYQGWCAKHGRRTYGNPDRPDTMAQALNNYAAWEARLSRSSWNLRWRSLT